MVLFGTCAPRSHTNQASNVSSLLFSTRAITGACAAPLEAGRVPGSRPGTDGLNSNSALDVSSTVAELTDVGVHHLGTVLAHGLQVVELTLQERDLSFQVLLLFQ